VAVLKRADLEQAAAAIRQVLDILPATEDTADDRIARHRLEGALAAIEQLLERPVSRN
jgi:hypothetical protein